jgi:LysM repeat protein
MKVLKAVMSVSVVSMLVFSVGCAARQTVKPDATPDATQKTAVEETTPVATAEPTAVPAVKYVVKKGDTLWGISSLNKVYQDAFQWPAIYKANRDQITDPDIIEVGQQLDVNKNLSTEEVKDAVQKAKDTPPYKPHTTPRKTLPLKY